MAWRALLCAESSLPSYPGSLAIGLGTRIWLWIETRTWKMVETAGSHFSVALEPEKVPSRLRHTWSPVGGGRGDKGGLRGSCE